MPSESPLVTYRPNLDDPIGYLNRPVDSQYGFFVFPRAYPLRFREGSTINVSWNTQFDAVNLYFYQIGKVANSIQITSKLARRDICLPFVNSDKQIWPRTGTNGKLLPKKPI